MNDDALEQLMHDVLDGVATAEQRAELERRLASDPSARERYRSLEAVFETLGRVSMVEAPGDLHPGLMRALDGEPRREGGWIAALADAFRARPAPAFAMAAVSVVALGLLLWSGAARRDAFLAGDPPVTGTMARPQAAAAAALESGTARVRIALDARRGALVATLSGSAPAGAELRFVLRAEPDAVTLDGRGAELAAGDAPEILVLRLADDVDAVLRIEAPVAMAGELLVSLVTAEGADEHLFALGPRGEGP
jgi:hypothetical protein